MFNSNPLLKHLRSKPPRTKTAIAIIAALIPTLAVSYAQFYMRARSVAGPAVVADAGNSGDNSLSVFAAVGKIFEEGKKTVGSSIDSLANINTSVFESALISASSSGSTTSDKLNLGTIPGTNWSNATVTKSIEN